jgi:hypothetical protein
MTTKCIRRTRNSRIPAIVSRSETLDFWLRSGIHHGHAWIDFLRRTGNKNPALDPDLQELHLGAEEKRALVAFLRALSGTIFEGSR